MGIIQIGWVGLSVHTYKFTQPFSKHSLTDPNGLNLKTITIAPGGNSNIEVPAGSVVFYQYGSLGGKDTRFNHAAITTGNMTEFGPEVVDQYNGHVLGPHLISNTSAPEQYYIVIVFFPTNP